MNGTPRLRSSFPSTPDSQRRAAPMNGAEPEGGGPRRTLPNLSQSQSASATAAQPRIPLSVIDAPQQRLYATAAYVLLFAWKIWDWTNLVQDEADSFWLFIKWAAIDGLFFYGLPEMHIPWLEWSSTVTTAIFLGHAMLNGMLMFRVALPVESFLAVIARSLYDRELSISEHRVKASDILHNSSLIMGRQIINVLPEGSVTLNPDGHSYCVDHLHPAAKLPMRLNQTDPIYMELLRIDFTTNKNETIVIQGKELSNLKKHAEKRRTKGDESLLIDYTVKKPGLYRLNKIMEKGALEVQRRMSDTLVVMCPRALIKPSTKDKCIGDLSDLTIEVSGTPPLKIVYGRTVNRKDESFHFQSLQPEDLVSPLVGSSRQSRLVATSNEDVSWGQSHAVQVKLNESMTTAGQWLYSIDEVHDAAGNVANFSARGEDGEHIYPRGAQLERAFTVHERPIAQLVLRHNSNQIRVAMGHSAELPLKFSSLNGGPEDKGHTITWQFSPIDTLTADGDHGYQSTFEEFDANSPRQRPRISKPGLYTLRSISSQYCDGEIREPASVLLVNPPKPDLMITSQDIHDKCADSSIGILVDLDLSGTPPFVVHYEQKQKGRPVETFRAQVDGSRFQMELKPHEAGHFIYRFTAVDDAVYKDHPLKGQQFQLEQDVKPPASAYFMNNDEVMSCIDEPIKQNVILQGEPPFTLEYELVHNSKRKKQKVADINAYTYTVETEKLAKGGEYTLSLTSVQDKNGCKIFLNNEVKINIRRQKPKASWSQLEAKRSIMTLEDKKVELPLRLEGEAPWTIVYRNLNNAAAGDVTVQKKRSNDHVTVSERGVFELVSVNDRQCPGSVDTSANRYEVNWIDRPQLRIADSSGVKREGDVFVKREVCEGDVDALELRFSGSPPYHLKYKHYNKPTHGAKSVNVKELDAALGSVIIPLDTSKAGLQTYDFSELSDNAYDYNPKRNVPLVVEQTVNSKPTATFSKLGQTYKYCKDEQSGNDVIPITLHGQPPFYLEVDIKHQSSAKPETIRFANIESNEYSFRIPHNVLSLGTHLVSIRTVRDARGCQTDSAAGAPTIPVQVFDVPTIYALESRTDYCVGERISYTLSGAPPFDIYYTFNNAKKKAKSQTTNFKRIAEKPGKFVINAISDRASECKAQIDITKVIHEMPSVRISKGRQMSVDIHEGGEAEILFEFWGTPPFEFTYTRSTNAKKGQKSEVLEMKHEVSHEHSMVVRASQEGTYEVVAIKDAFCAFSTLKAEATVKKQKLLL